MTTSLDDSRIPLLSTGVPGFDAVLGGGLPKYSFNLIAGGPGAGKTTLAQQIVFAQASTGARALYFTVLGEPPMKMLRHMQQYSFFDATKFNSAVRFVNLSSEALEENLENLLGRILAEIHEFEPNLVVVDSFRTVTRGGTSEQVLQEFVQRLALHLTSWEATTFLVGEYELAESHNPIFTVADGIFWLTQSVERSSSVRQLQVTKSRGCATIAGLHAFSISRDGIRVFPRVVPRLDTPPASPGERQSSGVPGLDAMMNGGIPRGETTLVVGPSGSGKSLFARHFIASGAAAGERSVLVVFEEHPGDYLARSDAFGPKLRPFVDQKLLEIASLRPLDLSVEEALAGVREAVERTRASRLVIDSLSGFELALAPSFRQDVRESLFRMISGMAGQGVTLFMTMGVVESFTELTLSPHVHEFLADSLVLLRYVEFAGAIDKVVAVIKMRSSAHELHIRHYTVGPAGVSVGERVTGYRGIVTGMPLLTAIRGTKPPPANDELERDIESESKGLQTDVVTEESRRDASRDAIRDAIGDAIRDAMKTSVPALPLDRLKRLGYLTLRRLRPVPKTHESVIGGRHAQRFRK